MHLPVAVHRHPWTGHHPDHPEPSPRQAGRSGESSSLEPFAPHAGTDPGPIPYGRLAARNLTRDTVLAERVEVAAGLWGKFKGLMGRPSLDAGAALWLPDSNGIHMMFMRFPIDAVFLGRPEAAARARSCPSTGDSPPGGASCRSLGARMACSSCRSGRLRPPRRPSGISSRSTERRQRSRATVTADTPIAPAASSGSAQAASVAPGRHDVVDEDDPAALERTLVVVAHRGRRGRSRNAPWTFVAREDRSRSNWAIVARARSRIGAQGRPSSRAAARAISSAWS